MAFENLKTEGIRYLLTRLKEHFLQIKDAVRTVNNTAADDNGNIRIDTVPYAVNLVSDGTQTSHDDFIMRTSGGTASIDTGEAWLMDIRGNSIHEGFVAEELYYTTTSSTIEIAFDKTTFKNYVSTSRTVVLTYSDNAWSENPALYGITYTGDPEEDDTITIPYTMEQRGIIYQSNPQAFRSTRWNLFRQTDGYARVIKYSEDRGFRIEGTYTAIQYSATLNGARTALTVNNGNFDVPADGYVWVTGGNSSDTEIYMTHTDWTESANGGEFEPYSEFTIDLSSLSNGENCPFPHGLLNVGTVSDEVNLNLGIAISRVERLEYNAENLATAKNSGREYEYDTDFIYLARATEITSSVEIDGSFIADDHGMEIFDETDAPVTVQALYGNNLKNKLERDVVTISQQTLQPEQKEQARNNIGAISTADLPPIVNALNSTSTTSSLSAAQGKALNDGKYAKPTGVSIANGATGQISVGNSKMIFVAINGYSNTGRNLLLVYAGGTGNVRCTEFGSSSGLSFDVATANTLKIANSSGNSVTAYTFTLN